MMQDRRSFLALGAASVAAASVGLPALTAGPAAAAGPAATHEAFVMGYFTESPTMLGARYALHLAVSPDGLNWTPLNDNNPVATPTAGTGGLRDPFILRRQDGTFVVLATDLTGTDFGQRNQYIHAWDSADLRSFTGYRRLRLHDRPTHTWAPEAFWDPERGQYGIFYSANFDGVDSFFVNYTPDFVTVSGPQPFFAPGYPVLDGTLHHTATAHYLYYKHMGNGRLYGARSSTLRPRSFDAGTYTGGVIQGGIEAPIVQRANDRDQWYLWGDSYAPVNGRLHLWTSGDITGDHWTEVDRFAYTQPLNAKHATTCPLTAAEHAALLDHWGTPTWHRVRSYNHPDRFLRHAGFAARLDAYPFDPYPDAQWRLVAGLADPAGVSFESVNYPGHFLRHQNLDVVLAERDGSATFAADATFHRQPGLADAGWASFRSVNYPDHYLRHAEYLLRIDPLGAASPATDRRDATFQLTY
ncbi:glycoside hydrolase family 43 protein [Streptomyces sp. DSM 44915]|uniref:Glycoside hydrolase family 43 protein n=1 Tax=Streptomyces chisholmiae TaxID=3075540 RepID=A0ABU2JV60_9ACTN|nr:glycoside hydrolase family 43 protein [Streptomyces sp. DSM 44915]MDT0268641.1 glycoside hydrolase family 43 protein [Streptomyces sp. DSM 44915]